MRRPISIRPGRSGLASAWIAIAVLAAVLSLRSGFAQPAPGDRMPARWHVTFEAGTTTDLPALELDDATPLDDPALDRAARKTEATTAAPASRFNVDYYGFPADAQRAFQAAVDTWSKLVSSPVPIHIEAYYEDYYSGVLGATGVLDVVRNAPGAPLAGVYYPSVLVNRFAGTDVFPGRPDMLILINSNGVHWYTGSEPHAPEGTFDLTTVALQEIAHGLGIIDSGDYYDDYFEDERYGEFLGPSVLDTLLHSGAGQALVTLPDPSKALYRHFISGDLYFDGPNIREAAGGPIAAFAPPVILSGSSLSHLDESVYPDGDPNALMTPYIARREVIRQPGPYLLALLADIGWAISVDTGPSPTPTPTRPPFAYRAFAPMVSNDGSLVPTTPVPTNPARPPQPVEVDPPLDPHLDLLEVRHASWQIDSYGDLVILGEIYNGSTVAVGDVYLLIELHVKGEQNPEILIGYPVYPHVGSRQDTPFMAADYPPDGEIERVTVTVVFAVPPEFQVPPASVTFGSRRVSEIGVLHVAGTIRNTGSISWYSVIPFIATYAPDGLMTGLDWAFPRPATLGPGGTTQFDWATDVNATAGLTAPLRAWVYGVEDD